MVLMEKGAAFYWISIVFFIGRDIYLPGQHRDFGVDQKATTWQPQSSSAL